jgi:uncharacterized protein YkwD
MSRTRRSTAVLTFMVLGGLLAPTFQTVASAAKDNPCYQFSGPEKDLAGRMNQTRKRHGLGRMHHDAELSRVARVNAKRNARNNVLDHTPLNKLQHRVTREVVLGEGVAVAATNKRVMKLFMGSPAHRALILGSFEHFGVGIEKRNGLRWVTVVFAGHKNPGTTLSMPDC